MIVAWTGHRPALFREPVEASATVDFVARDLLARENVMRFQVGGQRGVDTWAAQAALDIGIPLSLFLPLNIDAFTVDWTLEDRKVLDAIVGRADAVQVVGGDPQGAFTERNRLLITGADLLVAVWTGTRGGGTAETIAFARQAS